jgi:hypothetical protein
MKNWSFFLAIIILVVIIAVAVHYMGLWKTMSHEELEGSFEILDVETKWVEKIYQPWPPRLKLVPSISFRIKNTSDKPLKYVYFNANFKVRDDISNLGDGFLEAIGRQSLMPGETSQPILLKSNYGFDGTNLEHFKTSAFFKSKVVDVKLFAKSQGSQYIPIGEWEVSQTIDFKEPEPYGMEEEKPKRGEKK